MDKSESVNIQRERKRKRDSGELVSCPIRALDDCCALRFTLRSNAMWNGVIVGIVVAILATYRALDRSGTRSFSNSHGARTDDQGAGYIEDERAHADASSYLGIFPRRMVINIC
jgi:SPW repeat